MQSKEGLAARMYLDFGTTIARIEAHTLIIGVSLQVIACLMNSTDFHKAQIGIGLLGVVLMIIGFNQLPE